MLSVILIGISLSMDAFAVSVTNGIAMRPFKTGYALWHGLYFGAFQFLMPLAGYILGSTHPAPARWRRWSFPPGAASPPGW